MSLRKDTDKIAAYCIDAVLPNSAVAAALKDKTFGSGRLILISVGKAAWQMARTACDILKDKIDSGVVITKYDHSKGDLPNMKIFEAGHPVPDENSFAATQAAIDAVSNLCEDDTVLFLLSGGGSALFEKPLILPEHLTRLTNEFLASGADIVEMNTVRKRFSAVKGGKFAQICSPAKVYSIVLSDIIGDPLDMIASGPAYPDSSTCEQARKIAQKYKLTLSEHMRDLLNIETPKELDNVETHITGSVTQLCSAAEKICSELGYKPTVLTASLSCSARDAGVFLSNIAQYHAESKESLAFIAGGETTVRLIGNGMGGRNQEIALAAAEGISKIENCAVFSLGSDGNDGPTDAAGGFVDNTSFSTLLSMGINAYDVLQNNDAYTALSKIDGLIKTGATGTNVNDVSVLLIKR